MNVELQVIGSALRAVAEEMGAVLIRSAFSANIKERRDCSTAIFDEAGRMIAQAEHIPVHLGAMPDAVAAAMPWCQTPGQVCILNDPYTGGTHLPDVTLVSRTELGFAVSRAHHADVGGMSPGSMPQGATELVQEGLVLPPVLLSRGGVMREDMLRVILANVRTPAERSGDLRAQLAACAAGANGLRSLIAREGRERVAASGRALIDYTARRAASTIRALGALTGRATDTLEGDGVTDDPVTITVALRTHGDRLVLDFTGTSPQVRGNVNCPLAVTRAAAVFVLRTLLPDDVPTNDGIARAIEIVAEPGSAVHARWPAAVAAGNVEMSQRITDTLFAALASAGLDVPAQGQGTMNNVTFGGDGWTFYETLGGGQGASSRGPGPSAVHVGMSNTRNTPIESLEWAYPIRIEEYSMRRGSGGAGVHAGGDGVVRRYRALEPCTVTLLTERRRRAPAGAAGGASGATGRNLLNGKALPAKCRVQMKAGDVLTIETPGGGGWGKAGG